MYVFFRIPSMRIFLQSGKTSWGSSKGCCLFAARDLYEPSTLLKKARPSMKPQVFAGMRFSCGVYNHAATVYRKEKQELMGFQKNSNEKIFKTEGLIFC